MLGFEMSDVTIARTLITVPRHGPHEGNNFYEPILWRCPVEGGSFSFGFADRLRQPV